MPFFKNNMNLSYLTSFCLRNISNFQVFAFSDAKLKKWLDRFFDSYSNRRERLYSLFPYFPRKITEINSSDVNCVSVSKKHFPCSELINDLSDLKILQLTLKLIKSV